jgi:hypothetical protein
MYFPAALKETFREMLHSWFLLCNLDDFSDNAEIGRHYYYGTESIITAIK